MFQRQIVVRFVMGHHADDGRLLIIPGQLPNAGLLAQAGAPAIRADHQGGSCQPR